MSLKGKRILITAGPTWVAIDKIRVISNTATGENGIILAEELRKHGALVTLLLGPVNSYKLNKKIRLIRFTFFDQLKNTVIKELKRKKYDCLIHSAAVSDYKPKKTLEIKAGSDKTSWQINLIPTPKIINLIRETARSIFLVGFKFEPDASKKKLLQESKLLQWNTGSNLIVANTLNKRNQYRAYIIDGSKTQGPFTTKKSLCLGLVDFLEDCLEKCQSHRT